MPALSERKAEIVRTLVEAAPDSVLGTLQQALSDPTSGDALVDVRRLVDAEAHDRRLRNMVLRPIVPMCVGDGQDSSRLTFPGKAAGLVWKGLKAVAPGQVGQADAIIFDYRPGETSTEPFDVLVSRAAKGLRERDHEAFAAAADLCDAARPGGAETLAACMDLGPVLRKATYKLPDWTSFAGERTTASARLAYKDAVAVAHDAGPRFFEMLAAQLPQPWMILRIISAVMDKPTERYLADSEMAGFGERVITGIDEALRAIAQINLDGGPSAGRGVGKLVELVTHQTNEIETCVDLGRDHGWGARLIKQKKALAVAVEKLLKQTEKAMGAALPMHAAKVARILRTVPRLNETPNPQMVLRAATLLNFTDEIRSSANYGGFASVRGKTLDRLGDTLDHYVEEVLELMKAGEVEETLARAYMDVVADFTLLIRDPKAAELVRRRAAAAAANAEPHHQAGAAA